MNDLITIFVSQSRFDLMASKALDFFKLRSAVINQPPGELSPTRTQAGNQIPPIESPSDFCHAGGKQTLSFLNDGLLCSIIHDDVALRFRVEGNPMFPATQGFSFRKNQRPDLFSLQDLTENSLLGP